MLSSMRKRELSNSRFQSLAFAPSLAFLASAICHPKSPLRIELQSPVTVRPDRTTRANPSQVKFRSLSPAPAPLAAFSPLGWAQRLDTAPVIFRPIDKLKTGSAFRSADFFSPTHSPSETPVRPERRIREGEHNLASPAVRCESITRRLATPAVNRDAGQQLSREEQHSSATASRRTARDTHPMRTPFVSLH
jgi:hypothetical protein